MIRNWARSTESLSREMKCIECRNTKIPCKHNEQQFLPKNNETSSQKVHRLLVFALDFFFTSY